MKPSTFIATAIIGLSTALVYCKGVNAGVAQQRPSPPDRLEWFELEVDPFVLRFSVLPGDPIFYSKNPHGDRDGDTRLLPREDPLAASVVKSLDALITAHHLMESTPNEPEKTFKDETVRTPSVHLRIGYGTDGSGKNRRWQSYYRSDALPANIKEFVEACTSLGDSLGRSVGGPAPSAEETREEIREILRRSVAAGKLAVIKITAKGDIYLNDKQVSLEQLGGELRRVKKANGGVLYRQEPPENGSRKKAAAVADAVMRKVRELKLELAHGG